MFHLRLMPESIPEAMPVVTPQRMRGRGQSARVRLSGQGGRTCSDMWTQMSFSGRVADKEGMAGRSTMAGEHRVLLAHAEGLLTELRDFRLRFMETRAAYQI